MDKFLTLIHLAQKSLWNRKFSTSLTALSIALSVALLLSVERVRLGARESFANTISQTHLIVGAKGGTLQLLLYAVFRMGSATNNISYETYKKYESRPEVEWAIPISLGDSYRGFRVVATNEKFYKHYRFRKDKSVEFGEGKAPVEIFDVALGSEVARKLQMAIGSSVILTHGVTDQDISIQNHETMPFKVVGILAPTGTPVDKSVYITLEGMEAIHMDWADGGAPLPGTETNPQHIRKEDLKVEQITAFLLRAKSFPAILPLQREISLDPDEPLMAIIPGVVLDELWRTIGYAEDALRVVTGFVVIVGLFGMLLTLYASVNERRREMAILRAIGLSKAALTSLLVFEAWLLGTAGAILGTLLTYFTFAVLRPYAESQFGLLLPFQVLSALEIAYLGVVSLLSVAIGGIPALRAYRNSVADGLSTRI